MIEYLKAQNENGEYLHFYIRKNNLMYAHNEKDPAIQFISGKYKGRKIWFNNGKWHREDAAAAIYENGDKQYWFEDKLYENIKSDEEWVKLVKLLKLLK